MRIRTIKPEFFTHDRLFDAEIETKLPLRLAYIGLWCAADREGRFRWEPRRLKALIFPYDKIDFARVLDALGTRGFIVKYSKAGVDDACFGSIPSWHNHQVINNRERASQLPEPPTDQHSFDACGTRAPRVDDAGQGEGKGREGKEGKEVADASVTNDEDWLKQLAINPAYSLIDVRREYSKMQTWCGVNRKMPTRRRFVAWLNRIEKPMDAAKGSRTHESIIDRS
jgi:hypothetical protein